MINPENLRLVMATMCRSLLRDSSPTIRIIAAETLGKLGNEDAIPYLCQAWRQDDDINVRLAAANAIVQISKPQQPMSDAPKFDLRGAQIGNLADTVQGDQVYNAAASQDFAAALTEVRQLLETLQQKYPTATAADAPIIMRAELVSMQTNQPQQWAMVKRNLLNRDRWLKGGKAAVIEVTKDLAEKNTVVKGAIAFLEAFSEEVEIAG